MTGDERRATSGRQQEPCVVYHGPDSWMPPVGGRVSGPAIPSESGVDPAGSVGWERVRLKAKCGRQRPGMPWRIARKTHPRRGFLARGHKPRRVVRGYTRLLRRPCSSTVMAWRREAQSVLGGIRTERERWGPRPRPLAVILHLPRTRTHTRTR